MGSSKRVSVVLAVLLVLACGAPGATSAEPLSVAEDVQARIEEIAARIEDGRSAEAEALAREAMTHAERHVGSIDLVVSDVVLPGIDGRDVVQRLRRARPSIARVLFVSGHADELPNELPLPHGFLRKPFSRDELLRKIRDVLDGESTRRN